MNNIIWQKILGTLKTKKSLAIILSVILVGAGAITYFALQDNDKENQQVSSVEESTTDELDETEQEDKKSDKEVAVESVQHDEESEEPKDSDNVEATPNQEVEDTTTVPQYTYAELSKTMYATTAVNVRDLPCKEGSVLGGLSKGQEVSVKGQCQETSWFQIVYNNTTGFVSNNYLSDAKPEVSEQTTHQQAAQGSQNWQESQGAQQSGLPIVAGWVQDDNGVWCPADIMPGGTNYDVTFHSQWDGHTYQEYLNSVGKRLVGTTPTGSLFPIPNEYVIGSYAVYHYEDFGETIYFKVAY